MGDFHIRCVSIVVASLVIVGCGGEYESMTGSSLETPPQLSLGEPEGAPTSQIVGAPSEEDVLAFKSIEEEMEQTQQMMSDVDKQYDRIKDMEKIVFIVNLVFKSSSEEPVTSASTEPEFTKSLSNPVKSAMEKIKKAVDRVYSFDDRLLQKIEALELRLDPSVSGHQALLAKLDFVKGTLAAFEDRLDEAIKSMADKVQSVIFKIDGTVDSYLFFDPRRLLLKKGKDYFQRLHNHLLSHLEGDATS